MVSSNSTFEELIQTGNIGVISNRSLVNELTEFYDRIDRQRGDDDLLLSQAEGMLDWRASMVSAWRTALAWKTLLIWRWRMKRFSVL